VLLKNNGLKIVLEVSYGTCIMVCID